MNGFSIIICTYNPAIGLLERLFTAINRLETSGFAIEVLLVDNNSIPPITEYAVVQDFLEYKPYYRLIRENEPGLTAARRAGISNANYDWLIFFDDDNEPVFDYLIKAAKAIEEYPKTGAWGAAEVEVEYIGKAALWLEEAKPLFQQRNNISTIFDCKQHWQECYPFGTGLIIKKEIAAIYESRVAEKRYTLTDRKGKSLASGGDVQLVLTGIEQGYYAGVIEGLKITHLIDVSKATLHYLQKQQYGTASAYVKAFNQVFVQSPVLIQKITNKKVLLTVYSLFRINRKAMSKERYRLLLASKMGELNAHTEAAAVRKPFLLKLYELLIHV